MSGYCLPVPRNGADVTLSMDGNQIARVRYYSFDGSLKVVNVPLEEFWYNDPIEQKQLCLRFRGGAELRITFQPPVETWYEILRSTQFIFEAVLSRRGWLPIELSCYQISEDGSYQKLGMVPEVPVKLPFSWDCLSPKWIVRVSSPKSECACQGVFIDDVAEHA